MTNAGNADPNAVQTVNLASGGLSHYSYDNNGSRISGDGNTISYNAFNKPVTISTASSVMSFSYGADGMRYKQVKSSAAGVVITAGVVSYRSYIDDIAIVMRDEVSGQALDGHRIRYTQRDRLGSVISLTDHNNLLMEHRSYDPFGKPRHGSMQDPLLARLSSIAGGTPFTTRGFTDHEHLDDAELIHMNGRVYDYNLGRFLSVDPFIQAPGNSQSMNPYSYIMNNPLAGTDPSGYTSCHVDETVGDCGLKPGETAEIVDDDGKSLGSATISDDGKTLKTEGNNGVNSATTSINGQAFTVNVQNVADIGSQQQISKSDAAGLSNAAYGKNGPPKGWSAVTGKQLEENFGLTEDDLNTDDGLNASLFYNEDKDIYALAYAGTDLSSWADIKADILQNFGFESKQYTQALAIASIISTRVGSSGLVFTGHSLGGGLASAASLKTGRFGYTFNAAGLHKNTMGGSIDHVRANRLITAYYAASDPLSYVQDNKWVGYSLSEFTKLPISFAPAVGRRVLVDGARGHNIQSMYDALR